MTPQQRLNLYKEALKDWEKPYTKGSYTNFGFCNYFKYNHNINLYCEMFEIVLPELYEERMIKYGCLHYKLDGDTKQGRQERVQALKNAIKKLEIIK